ncbi:hypothetical protein [uncultured Sulfitobacter sp.]|uniref:hypothetical protein n=1 Tax=uncultured Sulfitobacter sp. TaxID=191468 RepID=UPI00261E8A79|nr:hypothetical protein [uncultured Sulfitobacter sp.]
MNHILRSLPLIFVANASVAHEAPHLHHHLTDPNWMPLAVGLLIIGFAAFLAWSCK